LGLIGLVLVAAGFEAKRRWLKLEAEFSADASFLETPPSRKEHIVPIEPQAKETNPPAMGQEAFLTDAILSALVFNQLPVKEERAEPLPNEPVETKPRSRKFFRIDPPEEQQAQSTKEPYIAKRPTLPKPEKAKPPLQEPLPLPEANRLSVLNPGPQAKNSNEPASLLDRALQRVHQNRAA
jgi:hypothetical protein